MRYERNKIGLLWSIVGDLKAFAAASSFSTYRWPRIIVVTVLPPAVCFAGLRMETVWQHGMPFEPWMVVESSIVSLSASKRVNVTPPPPCVYTPVTPPQDLKAAARNESMVALRRAAGLEAIPTTAVQRLATIVPSPLEPVRQSTAAEGDAVTAASKLAADGAATTGEDSVHSVTNSSHDGKCTGTKGNDNIANRVGEHPPDREDEDRGNAHQGITDATTSRQAEAIKDQSSVGAPTDRLSLATRTLRAKPDGGDRKSRAGKAAAVVSSVAGRGRREEVRRRAELYEVCRC